MVLRYENMTLKNSSFGDYNVIITHKMSQNLQIKAQDAKIIKKDEWLCRGRRRTTGIVKMTVNGAGGTAVNTNIQM